MGMLSLHVTFLHVQKNTWLCTCTCLRTKIRCHSLGGLPLPLQDSAGEVMIGAITVVCVQDIGTQGSGGG